MNWFVPSWPEFTKHAYLYTYYSYCLSYISTYTFHGDLDKTVTDIALQRIGGNSIDIPPLQTDPGRNDVGEYTTKQIWAESGHRMPRLDITEE